MKAIIVVDVNDDTYLEPEADVIIDNGDFRLETKAFLKPLPQKDKYDVDKYATVDFENDVTLGHFLNKGWNDCIDAITGDKK